MAADGSAPVLVKLGMVGSANRILFAPSEVAPIHFPHIRVGGIHLLRPCWGSGDVSGGWGGALGLSGRFSKRKKETDEEEELGGMCLHVVE